MRIPEFKSTAYFLGETPLPCLVATLKNSQLAGLATRHIAAHHKDPVCEIYLVGKEPEKICEWQQALLKQLFEQDGLAGAVTEGMKEYEAEVMGEPYEEFNEKERQQIQQNGIAPFLIVDCIVIDAIEREALIQANNEASIFTEHGITIFLRDGHWHFADGDYFGGYLCRAAAGEQPLPKPSKFESWLGRLLGRKS